jgi:hypothetical protein
MLTVQTQNKASEIISALKKAGIKDSFLPVLLGQVANETAYKGVPFNSPVSQNNNNYSGITWINKKAVQKGANKGTMLNLKETKGKAYYYAKFDTLQDWANDYARILSIGHNPPIKAINTTDFVSRLKENRYFTDSVETYLKNVNYWLAKFKDIKPVQTIPFIIPLLLLGLFLLSK